MQLGQPSRTALATDYARAYHQPRIFTDPLAVRITGVTPDQLVDLETATLQDNSDLRRRRRLFLAARARFAISSIPLRRPRPRKWTSARMFGVRMRSKRAARSRPAVAEAADSVAGSR